MTALATPITTTTSCYCKPNRTIFAHSLKDSDVRAMAIEAFIDTTSNEGPSTKRYCDNVSKSMHNYGTDQHQLRQRHLAAAGPVGRAILAHGLEEVDVR